MGKINIEERIEFLSNEYNVFDSENLQNIVKGINDSDINEVLILSKSGYTKLHGVSNYNLSILEKIGGGYTVILNQKSVEGVESSPKFTEPYSGEILGILVLSDFYGKKAVYDTKTFYINSDIFIDMLEADPTANKKTTQWMLNVFSRYAKDFTNKESITKAIQFSTEDLGMAKTYLEVFEQNKRKAKFKKLCNGSPLLKTIKDVTNINQYTSLSQLYDAVDPFIEKDSSGLLGDMMRFVAAGDAIMPVRDRKYTLFIPLSRDASELFNKLASWCTTSYGNSMFSSYTGQKGPDGKNSYLYIIIDNDVYDGKSDNVWQFHFESEQYKDKGNSSNINVYNELLSKSETLFLYFKERLTYLASEAHKTNSNVGSNKYVNIAKKFQISDVYLEMLPSDTAQIEFKDLVINEIGSLEKFKSLTYLSVRNCGLKAIPPSISACKNALTVISFHDNKITEIPDEVSYCLKAKVLTMTENSITTIHDSIAKLDNKGEGSLQTFSYTTGMVAPDLIARLVKLLPNVRFIPHDKKEKSK